MGNNKDITLLVLAAGMGSRYGGIKQIDGFGPSGETIMDYSLYDAIRAGFTKVVFIVRDEILDTVKERFEPKLKGKLKVDFVIQALSTFVPEKYQNTGRTKPWGTSHAVLCAKDVIKEPFAVINADDFYGRSAFKALADFFNTESEGAHAMVGYTLKNVLSEHGSVSRGCGEQDANGYLKSVVERTTIVQEGGKIIAKEKDGDLELSPETPTSMNFWGFQPNIFPLIESMFEEFLKENSDNPKAEFFIPLVGNKMIQQGKGKVKVLGGGDIWFGVTYKEDKEEVTRKIQELVDKGEYPAKLWS
ncbi:nucleotidyltransferase [Chryseotalea sanaruensis]|uniref:Nucleotidyltransferase n=1 Tax=Chryseotalea sanaruensis TaxID=2482724 RepID=A0A401UCK6_9BACT|nr:sugar phosphate nucleotidyltransferase [Chryseotalea sanaruensis]GCC52628.1 nucleotidyltransferase [Chryseotalea sanaruensis]